MSAEAWASTEPDRYAAGDDWRSDAACRGEDPALFFPGRGGSVDAALAVCDRCPVRAECADAGRTEYSGVWGGMSERQRRLLRSHRLDCPRCGRQFATVTMRSAHQTTCGRPVRHGSIAGYSAHRRSGETPCPPCAEAYRLDKQMTRRRGTAP